MYLDEEEEMQRELSQIVNDLKENPMLGLFQAGNELVHSNLLAWILEYNNDQLISQKLKSHLSIPQEHRIKKVFREKRRKNENNKDNCCTDGWSVYVILLRDHHNQRRTGTRDD